MPTSEILRDKLILAVDDETDVLDLIEEELSLEWANVTLHTAKTLEKAQQCLALNTYDLVVLNIMGGQGFNLLQVAHNPHIPTIMLTAHAFTPEDLRKSIQMGAWAYVSWEKLGSLTPFLEDVLRLNYHGAWRRSLEEAGGQFSKRFGNGWRKAQQEFWAEFEEKISVDGRHHQGMFEFEGDGQMEMLPEPYEVRATADDIKELMGAVKEQNKFLQRIEAHIAGYRSNLEELKHLTRQLEAVNGTLSVASDSLGFLTVPDQRRV